MPTERQYTLSLPATNCPVAYTADGNFPHGRILAVDFMGGSFDVRNTHGLTDFESNTFALQALGYTLEASAQLLGKSLEGVTNRLERVGNKTDTLHRGASASITAAFDSSLFRVSRPIKQPDVGLTEKNYTVWNGTIAGETNAQIARRLGIATNTVEYRNTQLYRKLSVANKAAATLLAHLISDDGNVPTSDTSSPVFDFSKMAPERFITSVHYKSGKFEPRTDKLPNYFENSVLLLASSGMNAHGISISLHGNEYPSQIAAVSDAVQKIEYRYGTRNMDDILRRACIAGHMLLIRECIAPEGNLTIGQAETWGDLAYGLTPKQMAETRHITATSAAERIERLCGRLDLSNSSEAAMYYWMTHPLRAMLPEDNTYDIRQASGVTLPNPRTS